MRRMPTPQRGFTLVELLVVIAIIGMLVALLIPAVGAARARMRKAACLNNMREIGTALINFETTKQRLPGYVESVQARGRSSKQRGYVAWSPGSSADPMVGGSFYNTEDTNDPSVSMVAWSALILPQIDRGDIWDLIQGAEGNSGPALDKQQQVLKQIALYVCPDDTDLTSQPEAAGMTYVVNTGNWDYDASGDFIGDSKSNGLFMMNVLQLKVNTRLTDADDGSATTLMVTENATKNFNYSWFGVLAFGEQQLGTTWVFADPPTTGCGNLTQQYPFNDDGLDSQDGNTPAYRVGEWPANMPCFSRPFSNHFDGGFNTIFADGHGRSLKPDLDYRVYQQLMTPRGAKIEDLADVASDELLQGYRTLPPLSESDLD